MEAECAISNMDFIFKIHIALKECSETLYWLDSLKDTFFVTEEMHAGIYRDGEALKSLFTSNKKSPPIKKNSPPCRRRPFYWTGERGSRTVSAVFKRSEFYGNFRLHRDHWPGSPLPDQDKEQNVLLLRDRLWL
ncbi:MULTISPECIES: four helix bundle protein [unclassified Akkermansia]|uniref:four helix bundle protein n=2 Tax=unclassified Akkermansia TaxID=2608915 RepID=UPI00193104F2|nr:four helix bundle protein [Akkermansia sp.]